MYEIFCVMPALTHRPLGLARSLGLPNVSGLIGNNNGPFHVRFCIVATVAIDMSLPRYRGWHSFLQLQHDTNGVVCLAVLPAFQFRCRNDQLFALATQSAVE